MTIQASRTTHQGSGGHRGRFLPSWIDDEAGREPKRVCIQIAASRTTEAVQVTVGELANAINRAAWWLDDTLGKPGKGFPTVAYLGPSDLRYLIFVVAAVKAGYKVGDTFIIHGWTIVTDCACLRSFFSLLLATVLKDMYRC